MSSLNIQTLPKDKEFLTCFRAAPGHKLLYTDFDTVEPKALAHFSQDPGLMSLYGPDAKPNCVYLYVGSRIGKYKDNILKYYDPNNPTPEGIAAAKKYAKAERQATKPGYLGWVYGLGARTMHQDTEIPIDECREILADIGATFPDVGKFYIDLRKQWNSNGGWVKQHWDDYNKRYEFIDGRPGWIYNGRGRPLGIAPQKIKDIGNRFIQTTGHDVLLQYLAYVNQMRIPEMRPYHVDNHDATIWQVREDRADAGKQVLEEAYVRLNDTLQWTVKISGAVEIGDNMGDFLEA